MFGLTALELARIKFGFTISFHIIFPAITIGLASYLAVLEETMALEKGRRLPRPLSFLVADIRRQLCHERC